MKNKLATGFRCCAMIRIGVILIVATVAVSAQTNVSVKAIVSHYEIKGRIIHYDQHPNGIEQTVYYEMIDRSVVSYVENKQRKFATNDVASTNKVIISHQKREGSEWVEK